MKSGILVAESTFDTIFNSSDTSETVGKFILPQHIKYNLDLLK